MAKAKKDLKAKAEKKKKTTYIGFNITLRSDLRNGSEAYTELFKELANVGYVNLPDGKAITLRNQFIKKVKTNAGENTVLYGQITKFTLVLGNQWYNSKKRDYVIVDIEPNTYPNGVETEYVFVPDAHRFFIKRSSKVSWQSTLEFLRAGLTQIIKHDEQITVTLIQSQDVIDRILDSKRIKSLHVEVSYTNQDIGPVATEVIDEMLRKAKVGRAKIDLRPDQTDGLDKESTFVKGLVGVAKENGGATASVVNAAGRSEKIITAQHPEMIEVETKESEDSKDVLTFNMMKKYRDGNTSDKDSPQPK